MNTNDNTASNKPSFGIVAERDSLKTENEELRAMLADLTRYLNSGKFADNTTVQVVDVLTRIGSR